jgi:hypothetical protein
MFKRLLPVLLACCVPLLLASPAMAELEFHLERFGIGVQNENGTPDVQAGSHPYSLTTTFVVTPDQGNLRAAQVELPPGFVGDPNATPKCTYQEFIKQLNKESTCSNDTAVGVATAYVHEAVEPRQVTPLGGDSVYNLVPPKGVAAEFGFVVAETTGSLALDVGDLSAGFCS